MNIRDLQYLTIIAEENNITRAAQRLFISQPSLSQVLKKVEAELDTTLFCRTADGLQPTFVGEEFLARADEILTSYRKLQHFISDVNELHTGRLNIGVPYYLNGSFLSEILPSFSDKYPGIDVHVTQQTDLELETMLSQGSLDLIIGLPQVISSKFKKSTVFQCRVVLSPPPEHDLDPLAVQKTGERFPTVPLSVLDGKTFLDFTASSPLHDAARTLLSRTSAAVHFKQLSGYGIEMVRRCSKAGMGYAIIPECMLLPRLTNPRESYFYLKHDEGIFYSVCIASSPDGYIPLAAQKLYEMAREYFDTFLK